MRKRNFKLWANEVKIAIHVRARLPWKIGDLLNYGEANYGEKYAQAFDDCLVEYHTMQNWRWLCRSFPVSRRRESLSWSHHEVVAKLSEKQQDTWLDRAERKRWSTRELRDEVRYKEGNKADIVIDIQYSEDFEKWKAATTLSAAMLRAINLGTMKVVGFDKKKNMPLVKPKIKAAA